MQRRRFFGVLAALAGSAPAVSGARGQPVRSSQDLLAEFNRLVGQEYLEADRRAGRYSIFFSGLKPLPDRAEMVGQWFAWPGSWMPVDERRPFKYFYAPVPGGPPDVYQYHPGDVFRIFPGLNAEMLQSLEGWKSALQAVDSARVRLVDHLRQMGEV